MIRKKEDINNRKGREEVEELIIKGLPKKEYFKKYFKTNIERIREQQQKYKVEHEEEYKKYQSDYQKQKWADGVSAYCYVFFNKDFEIIRVGSCNNLSRISRYKYDNKVPLNEIHNIIYVETPSRESAYFMEAKLIEYFSPKYNKNTVNVDRYSEFEYEIVNLEDLTLKNYYL